MDELIALRLQRKSSHLCHALVSLVGAITYSHHMSKSSAQTSMYPLRLTSIQVVTNEARFSLQGAADQSEQVWRVQCIMTYLTEPHVRLCMLSRLHMRSRTK